MAKKLWNEYLFLTREMVKFLDKQDFDLFYEIMRQREQLQEAIAGTNDDYKHTPEGREVLVTIRNLNQRITQKLQLSLNQAKYRKTVSSVYDGGGYGGGRPVGIRLDREG